LAPVTQLALLSVVGQPLSEYDRRLRRRFSVEDKRRILEEADACSEHGQFTGNERSGYRKDLWLIKDVRQ